MRIFRAAVRVSLLLALALVLANGTIWGQAGSSIIRGDVTDPQGKLIPGATVTIKNLSTGFSRSQLTTSSGGFSFELIPPGAYQLEVESKGFRKKVLNNVRALVGSPTDVPVQLEVGEVTETVVVEAASATAMINTQDATLGNNFVSQQITQLPLEARNVVSLLTLQPGVTREGYVAGARGDQSNVTLDGVDINEAQTNAVGFSGASIGASAIVPTSFRTDHPVLRLNSEAIEEFRVTTLNSNANQGRSSAAQINLVTKSGTNSFHGSAFEYHRNTIFTANDFFNNRTVVTTTAGTSTLPRPKLIRNTFGGTVGGPVKKDKLLFFYSYEGRRDAAETPVVRVVPLPSMGQGKMRVVAKPCVPTPTTDCPEQVVTLSTDQLNQAFPAVGINPLAVQVLAQAAQKYPFNDFTVGDSLPTRLLNTAGFRFNAPTPVRLNSHVAKMDWNITSKQTAFFRASVIYDLSGLEPQFPDTLRPNLWEHPWGLVGSHNWTIGRNWVNNFRYGFTRQAFTQQGDSQANSITFRFIFSPLTFTRTLSRTTPVHNFTDDVSWVKNSHTIQFGTNIRVIRNNRLSFVTAYDTAVTNPSFYANAGAVVSDAVAAYLSKNEFPTLISSSEAQNAATALIGRYSQYTARFSFSHDGSLQPVGTPTDRNFATEDYDLYFQDAWKVRRNLTLTYGLRYGLSRPVYEAQGFETKPNIPLDQYFQSRLQAAAAGTSFTKPITIELSGPANGKSPMYNWDYKNFQPRVAVAWTPNFQNGFLRALFGREGKSVIRSGFARINDYYGEALGVAFDLNNAVGFTQQFTISANTFNVSSRPAPLFTGFGQQVRTLPRIPEMGRLVFPSQQPADFQRRIESSLDQGLVAPSSYTWNMTIERELPAGLVVQASYLGRAGRNLLATRDVMALNNLVDPKSGMDWYTAGSLLERIRQTRVAPSADIPTIPYFENVFASGVVGGNLATIMNSFYGCPGSCGGRTIPSNFNATQTVYWIVRTFYGNDWTSFQDDVEQATGKSFFYQPQYGALSAWGTIANSDYHGLGLSVRQRYRSLQWDFNYTFAHSIDDASGLQTSGAFGSAFILNPIRQHDNRANSDFDIRHVININGIYQLPFGRGKLFGGGAGHGLDAVIGGWQLSGIFRWNTGLPIGAPFDDSRWATNWNVQSNVSRTRPVEPCITKGGAAFAPKLFGCDTRTAYQSFRNAFPGETGERNIFRLPGYINLDMGLSKAFTMPWNERQKLQLRWEVFNVANTQHFGTMDLSRSGYGMRVDPAVRNLTPPTNWSNFTGIQGTPRVMQVGARFEF